MTVFENAFAPQADLRKIRFKCSFTIVNWQPTPRTGFAEITDSRVWQTNVYEGVYFNDFIKSNLVQDILKKVIQNGMTGSSWRFKKCDRICLTVNSNELMEIGKYKIIFDVYVRWNLLKSTPELMDQIMMALMMQCQVLVVIR